MEHKRSFTVSVSKIRYLNLTVSLVHELISNRRMALSDALEACCSLRDFFGEQLNAEGVPYGEDLFDALHARSFRDQIQLIYD